LIASAPTITDNISIHEMCKIFIYAHHPLLQHQLSQKSTNINEVSFGKDILSRNKTQGYIYYLFHEHVLNIVSHIVQEMTTATNEFLCQASVYALSSMETKGYR